MLKVIDNSDSIMNNEIDCNDDSDEIGSKKSRLNRTALGHYVRWMMFPTGGSRTMTEAASPLQPVTSRLTCRAWVS